MNDRAMNITLVAMFGLSGLAMILVAWLQPSLVSQRVMAFCVGSVGLLVAMLRALTLKREGADDINTVPVRAQMDNR